MSYRSYRIPADLCPNRLAKKRNELEDIPYDLTLSNPTTCGLCYPQDLLNGLGSDSSLIYQPEPRGPLSARQAIADEYRLSGLIIDPQKLVLTASTSEAYGLLFKLLADPGETVLSPAPSYPLIEQLAHLEGLRALPYPLSPADGWRIDFQALESKPETVKALVVVHPNNPTGSFVHPDDANHLVDLCGRRRWALIVDEVFLSYPLDGGPGEGISFADTTGCLCFTLGGLSKSIGLPQLKLAWIVVSGSDADVRQTLKGLDYIADAYLSVSTPVALATKKLLYRGVHVRKSIAARCHANLRALRSLAASQPAITLFPTGGGWSAVIRVPTVRSEEDLCLDLLENSGVAVHPGYLFDFPIEGYLVLSLLPPEGTFKEGVQLLLKAVADSIA